MARRTISWKLVLRGELFLSLPETTTVEVEETTTTTVVPEETTTTVEPQINARSAAPAETLPVTGLSGGEVTLAIIGLCLLVLGALAVRSSRRGGLG